VTTVLVIVFVLLLIVGLPAWGFSRRWRRRNY
jgi:hypothetical protein